MKTRDQRELALRIRSGQAVCHVLVRTTCGSIASMVRSSGRASHYRLIFGPVGPSLIRCMETVDAEQAGMGGGIRYLSEEPTRNMVNQEHSHSCQVACARQLLIDAGVFATEQELIDRIGLLEGFGTTSAATAAALDALHPRLRYSGGAVNPEAAAVLFGRDPWIASLKTLRGTKHAVIVDELTGAIVHVRDPWGMSGPGSDTGTQATMKLSDFLEHWQWTLNNAVFPDRRK